MSLKNSNDTIGNRNNICTVTNNGIWVSERLAVGFAICGHCKARCYRRLGIRNGADGRTRIFCHICVHVHDNKACGKKVPPSDVRENRTNILVLYSALPYEM